jgi:hypothetical protein
MTVPRVRDANGNAVRFACSKGNRHAGAVGGVVSKKVARIRKHVARGPGIFPGARDFPRPVIDAAGVLDVPV